MKFPLNQDEHCIYIIVGFNREFIQVYLRNENFTLQTNIRDDVSINTIKKIMTLQ